MISAKQTKNIIDYMFSSTTGFDAPTATFSVSPTFYGEDPGAEPAVTLSGVITPNDGTSVSWTILYLGSPIATGSGSSVSHTLASSPATVGTYVYTLSIQYTNDLLATQSLNYNVSLSVNAVGYYGQLALPGDVITDAASVDAVLGSFTSSTQTVMLNNFNVVASNTGRIVLVVPNSYGTLISILDNVEEDVLDEFNLFNDTANARKVYTTINALVPGTYTYKLSY